MDRIKILHLEDDLADSELVFSEMTAGGFDADYIRVDNEKNFIFHLDNYKPDIVLADYSLPTYDGVRALKYCHQFHPDIPFILVSGTLGEEIAVTMLKFGASDYLLKQNLTRLVPAINHSLEQRELKRLKMKAEAELIQSEEKFRKIFENVQDVFFQVGPDGLILEISPSIFHISGYRREELLGVSVSQFHYDINELNSLREALTEKGEVWDFEIRLNNKSGKTIYTSFNAHILIDSNGQPGGMEGMFRDIDERKRFEIQLKEAKEKAEVSDRLKTAFLQNVSHEIRTPMNAIIGFSSLLDFDNTNHEVQTSFISTIKNASNQLLSIIDDIVDISSIEANAIGKNTTVFSLNSSLNSVLTKFHDMASEKNISLSLKKGLSDRDAVIKTDNARLIQILSNMINNAFKFTHVGKIEFGYNLKDSVLEFFVSDTGIGIEPEFHSKIFNSFYQVETSLSRRFGGTGLGLSICKAYVELLGGKIWVNSEVGKGSVFYFTIPYEPFEEPVLNNKDKNLARLVDNKEYLNILIVEDDDNNIKLIEYILKEINVKIYKARNGLEALEICKSGKKIDIILMDLRMPVMDGYIATNKIKFLFPGIPIIAQTSYSIDREKAMDIGCDDFICKPFGREELFSKIAEFVN